MTKYVTVIGNGESRRGFDITPLKGITTMVGCNAIFRDHNLEYVVCADRHMCQEAVNTVGKNTIIYTRENWYKQFAYWPNVKKVPDLPYEETKDKTNLSIGELVNTQALLLWVLNQKQFF